MICPFQRLSRYFPLEPALQEGHQWTEIRFQFQQLHKRKKETVKWHLRRASLSLPFLNRSRYCRGDGPHGAT